MSIAVFWCNVVPLLIGLQSVTGYAIDCNNDEKYYDDAVGGCSPCANVCDPRHGDSGDCQKYCSVLCARLEKESTEVDEKFRLCLVAVDGSAMDIDNLNENIKDNSDEDTLLLSQASTVKEVKRPFPAGLAAVSGGSILILLILNIVQLCIICKLMREKTHESSKTISGLEKKTWQQAAKRVGNGKVPDTSATITETTAKNMYIRHSEQKSLLANT